MGDLGRALAGIRGRIMALVRRYPMTTLVVNLGVVFLVVAALSRSPTVVGENQVGYGYKVVCVNDVLNGDAIIADLDLIKGTDVYGPDIEHLQLTVR